MPSYQYVITVLLFHYPFEKTLLNQFQLIIPK